MPELSDFQVIQGNSTRLIGDRGREVWEQTFDTLGINTRSQAILMFMVKGLTDTYSDVNIYINDHNVGKIAHYHGGNPQHWFSQIVHIGPSVLNNGENTLRIRAVDFPEATTTNRYDDFWIKDVVCFFHPETMQMKTVSGILLTRNYPEGGSAFIDLSLNSVSSHPDHVGPGFLKRDQLAQNTIVAPSSCRESYFDSTPCTTVGLREINIQVTDWDEIGGRPPREENNTLRINSRLIDRNRILRIDWEATSYSLIEEIAYLVTGPVSPIPDSEVA